MVAFRGFAVAITFGSCLLGLISTAEAREPLNAYWLPMHSPTAQKVLRQQGYDLSEGRQDGRIQITATRNQLRALKNAGLNPQPSGRMEALATTGYKVWRPFARPAFDKDGNPVDNLKTELEKLAAANPKFVKRLIIGNTVRGVPIVAIKVSRHARGTPDGSKPAVLYSSLQHAREWISGEVNRRLLHLFVDNYGRKGPALGTDGKPLEGVTGEELTSLVNTRELWFVLVCNPDGYDYTYESPSTRLWRKNLRDNDGDGNIGPGDGVDPNRNYPTNFNYDEEGSSSDRSSETYRGTAPASEMETRALNGLMQRVTFTFQNNYHSFGKLLLYPFGWQVHTHAEDEPLFRTLSGYAEDPAVPGFLSQLGAALYTTNGETTDHAYTRYGTLAWTTELSGGDPAKTGGIGGFVFQDDEADIQREFVRNMQFGLDMARAAEDPSNTTSYLGDSSPPFQVHRFSISYGNPQTVEVTAKRSLGAVTAHWQINGGVERTDETTEWTGGKRYGRAGAMFYHRMRASISGTKVGDRVRVWFEAGGKRSEAFHYDVESDSDAPVLIVANENYNGPSPDQPPAGPHYLSYYTKALTDSNVRYDVWDVDARRQTAPDTLGVLSHYKTVIWYTGDDYITRLPGQPVGTGAARVAHVLSINMRDYINEGGKLLFTGRSAGQQYFEGFEFAPLEPNLNTPTGFCSPDPNVNDGCIALSDDFFQYYLGGYIYAAGGGLEDDTTVFPVTGFGRRWTFGGEGAHNQVRNGPTGPASMIVTSSVLKPDTHPQFKSSADATYDRPNGAPYSPYTGLYYQFSGSANGAYKRLTTTTDLTRYATGNLEFRFSYDVESKYDYVFVEAHTVGQDDWTTLPDLNGHTSTDTGFSCERGTDNGSNWQSLHPFLAHYQTVKPDGTCSPTGTTGEWNAATANSSGWQSWKVDLSKFAGKKVEIAIAYVTDPSVLGLGAFVDDPTITGDSTIISQTSFEVDGGGWKTAPPPPGSPPSSNNWTRSKTAFEEGAVIKTPQTLWFGFGFEGIDGAQTRANVMAAALDYLGVT